jgi:hypothetical protein
VRFASCNRLERNISEMTFEQMLRPVHSPVHRRHRKTRISRQASVSRFGRGYGGLEGSRYRVRVENVLRGTEARPVTDIYEAFPTGVLFGDWDSTQDGRRYLFPVRLENGRYHIVRDFRRSIYPVYSGRRSRLPLDESRPFWERFALLQWWVQADRSTAFGQTMYTDPGWVLDQPTLSPDDMNELRLSTSINSYALRREFCSQFHRRFPQDTDNGCPADRSPPATIVTEDGDVPLIGAWPRD